MLSKSNYLRKVPTKHFLSRYPDLVTNYVSEVSHYSSDNDSLNKLYQRIGLNSLEFVKGLYDLEPNYASDKVTESLKSSDDYILVDDTTHFIVAKEESISNFNFLIEYINYNYADSTDYGNQSFLFKNSDGEGGFARYSFTSETLDLYSMKYTDGLFYMDKSVSISLFDENFRIIVKSALLNTYIPYVNLEIPLTYYEYIRVTKMCKLKYKKLFDDEDFTATFGMKLEQLKSVTSKYTIKSALTLITNHLEVIEHSKLIKFYKNLYSENFHNF